MPALTFGSCKIKNSDKVGKAADTATIERDLTHTQGQPGGGKTYTSSYRCDASDFLKLKDKQLQADFFKHLDSVRKIQYPANDQDIYNLVDITPAMLNSFLNDINIDSLQKNASYEHKYFFNIAPKGFTDSRTCADVIILRFFEEDCSFRVIIDNVYPVEEQGCAGGAQVIYGFHIEDNKIIRFGRQAAG